MTTVDSIIGSDIIDIIKRDNFVRLEVKRIENREWWEITMKATGRDNLGYFILSEELKSPYPHFTFYKPKI
mgnify:CR=1 FL=1